MNLYRALAWMACLASVHAETKTIEGFTLIDGTGKPAQADSAMIVTDGKIAWVGPAKSLKAPAGAERMKLAGKYVIPGLINLHTHLGNTIGLIQDPKNYTRANLEKNLKVYADYGVTTVMSMGSDQPVAFELRAEQRAGRAKTTRVFTAGRGFTGVGGYPTKAMGMKGVPYEAASNADITKAIDELAARKVDLVKIWVDDHLGKERKIPLDLSKEIIRQAHAKGIKVGAHIFYLQDAKDLVRAGLDGLAHSVRDKAVDRELIDLMKKNGAWQQAATFTRELSVFAYVKDPPFLNDPFFRKSVSADVLKTLASDEYHKKQDHEANLYPAFLETAKKNLKMLYDSGVNVGFGTDTGPPARFPGYFEHLEMEMMADAGFTPAQIVNIATKRGADFLGQSKTLGTLEAGKWADLVVLGKDPLADIKNLRAIETVWVAGNKAN